MPLKRKPYIGLDIGHYSIKAMVMEQIAAGWRINQIESIPTPENTIKDGVILDVPAMGQAISTLMGQLSPRPAGCHVSISGATVAVRNVRIPKMTEAMLRKSIKFEAGRYIPSSEDSYVEFEILGDAPDNQIDVLIVAATRDLVDSRRLACEAAGLVVDSVDLEPFASHRSLIQANYGIDISQDTIALVDIGFSSTKVSVLHKGAFAMTRSISQGGHNLTDALQKYFKLSYADAEEGKLQLDVRNLLVDGSPTENPPLRVMQPLLDDLMREMRRSLNYYQSQQNEVTGSSSVSWMLITGGGAKLKGISEYMSHKLGLKVYSAGIFDNPRFACTTSNIYGQGADLSVASGLAMRSFAKAA